MRRIYWRPQSISRTVLLLIAALSVGGLGAVEVLKSKTKQPYYQEKVAAAMLAAKGMEAIRDRRLELGHEIDPETDPAETGLIGTLMTPITSTTGSLSAKQTSVNPNFAAVIVDMLKRARVKEGDVVAVGASGSFPALNVCVYAALETLRVKPIIISSAAASQFGANLPDFVWLDMEKVLADEGLIPFRSVAASVGGYEDLGMGMTDEAKQLVAKAIERNGLKKIEADSFDRAVEQRMQIYHQHAKGAHIKAYINVGGGTISVGRSLGKKMYDPGLNLRAPRKATRINSVMSRFMRDGTPVIHLVQVEEIARNYGLPIAPENRPDVAVGSIYVREQYNPWLAAGVLVAIFVSLHAFLLSDLGFRLLRGSARKDAGHPQPMV